jgi:hypothetical protein
MRVKTDLYFRYKNVFKIEIILEVYFYTWR